MSISENLVQLEAKVEDDKPMDVGFIKEDLESDGFSILDINLNVADYGKWTNRLRKKFICVRGDGINGPAVLNDTRRCLDAMRTACRLTADDVMLSAEGLSAYLDCEI